MNKKLHICFIIVLLLSSCTSLEKQEKKASLHYQIALSFMKQCQYPKALTALKKAIKIKPSDPIFQHSLALVYFHFKKYKKALKILKKTLKLKPDFTKARLHLGRVLIEIGQVEEGIAEIKIAQKDLTYGFPENIHTQLGMAYFKKKNYSTAEKHFDVARKIKTKDCFLALYQAKSLYFNKKYKRALNILENIKSICANNSSSCSSPNFDYYFFIALSNYKLGDTRKAVANLKIFLDKEKNSEYLEQAREKIKIWEKIH